MESAENQVVRFPGYSGDAAEALAVREDSRLLVLVAAHDAQALAALYRHRGKLLYSLLVRMLVNEMEAQEVMQDTFVQIWSRAHEHDPKRSSPLTWMIMIARGLALDRMRARSRRKATQAAYEQEVASLEIEGTGTGGVHQAERDELAVACATALHNLPELQARAIQMAFFRGWTHEEIACAEGEPLGTVKARIRRGLVALRRVMKEYHG